MGKSTKTRARQSARTGSFEIFSYPQRSTPVRVLGLVWRWRIELAGLTIVIVTWVWLSDHLPTWAVGAVQLAVMGLMLAVPVSRRYIVRRVWCVISRHRVRKCFVQSRVMTHEGLLPLFVWTRPTPVGERLRLWLRPGLSAKDISAVTERIAAACWARDARVQVHTQRASTVWVEVIRRDSLGRHGRIYSPLLDDIPLEHVEDQDAELIPLPDRDTVTPPEAGHTRDHGVAPTAVPSARAASATAPTRTTTRTILNRREPVEGSAVPVLGWSGEDVSDYV